MFFSWMWPTGLTYITALLIKCPTMPLLTKLRKHLPTCYAPLQLLLISAFKQELHQTTHNH